MKINYSFIFLIIFSLYIGYFNYLLLFLLCLLFHELGHLLFIKLFKVQINQFSLSLYGGNLILNQNQFIILSKLKKVLIYSGGIIINLILFLMFKNTLFSKMNLLLFIFNILPIYPLDGYNLLIILFKNKTKINNITIMSLVILLIVSIYNNSLGFLIIILILIIKNISYYKQKDKLYLLNLIKNVI